MGKRSILGGNLFDGRFQIVLVGGDVQASGIQVGMAKQGRYLFQPHPAVYQIFPEGMAQHVRSQLLQSRFLTIALEDALDRSVA
jgi:hypothetical protein